MPVPTKVHSLDIHVVNLMHAFRLPVARMLALKLEVYFMHRIDLLNFEKYISEQS